MTDTESVPEPLSGTASTRLPGLDVTRAVALIGVVIVNYHGFLNRGDDGIDRSIGERIFHPFLGPLGTRFAATFVIVAGMGVTLMTNRSRRMGHSDTIRADRWKLARRGLLLYTGGLLLDWIWPGTILFFYGALFLASALLFMVGEGEVLNGENKHGIKYHRQSTGQHTPGAAQVPQRGRQQT